ncbi:MAG: D-alanyl-D-alanine carboxypeptidase/D-alanyl-D-alanine-endopeptidase, partial [Cyanophyceae cyanobacterium]
IDQRFNPNQNVDQSSPEPSLPEPWISHNAHQFFNPASNAKLLTTAAALTRLGSNKSVFTSLYLEPSSPQGQPNLWLVPLGDPTLDQKVLDRFAITTAQNGITAVDTLWVWASDFGLAQRGHVSSWEWGDLPFGYGAPVSTAVLNQNQMVLEINGTQVGEPAQVIPSDEIAAQQWQIQNQVITGESDIPTAIRITPGWPNTLHLSGSLPAGATDLTRIAVPQPATYLGDSFKMALEQRGIVVNQVRVRDDVVARGNLTNLDVYDSPSAGELVYSINQVSNNLYAETLLGWLALNLEQNADVERIEVLSDIFDLSTPAGRSRYALEYALAELGISSDQYRIADGSGLSRQNLVTPQTLINILVSMGRSRETLTFRQSLPIAGETGTLRNRFKDTVLEGKLIAKTGTLTGVSALSGYFPHSKGNWVAFSILVNHSNQPASVLRQAMDDLLVAIAETPSHCLGIESN